MHKIDLSHPTSRTLPALLKEQAAANPDTLYLVTDSQKLTFGEVNELCLKLAAKLADEGIDRGDHVGLFMQNSAEMVIAALATNLLGAVWIPINTDYKGDWLNDSLARSRPKLVFASTALKTRLEQALPNPGLPIICLDLPDVWREWTKPPPLSVDYDSFKHGDTCSVLWTSGTTGKSKGVLLSHNCWIRPIYRGTSWFYQSEPGDVIYNVLPMFHAGAWNTSVLRGLAEGITVVLDTGFSVQNFWERIDHFGATQSFTLGAMHMFLWNAPSKEDDASHSLRVLQAIPMPSQLAYPFAKRFGVRLAGSGYGQSECMMITTEANADRPIPENSIGFACKDTDIAIFNDEDEKLTVGEVGEIRIRPLEPNIICNGYLDDPQASAAAWRGEWFCTGDLGYMDATGAFFFSDRKKDSIRFAGRNISTMEVESLVRQHPGVRDVAAYGIPSKEIAGEDELMIAIIPQENYCYDYSSIAQHINDNAPYYFVPRYMEFVDSLPYTPTNKVQKYLLREKGVSSKTWDLKKSDYLVQR